MSNKNTIFNPGHVVDPTEQRKKQKDDNKDIQFLAKKFIDFATSPECVELGAKNGSYQFLVLKNAKQPQAAIDAGRDKIVTMDYDFEDAKVNTGHYVADWKKAVNVAAPTE